MRARSVGSLAITRKLPWSHAPTAPRLSSGAGARHTRSTALHPIGNLGVLPEIGCEPAKAQGGVESRTYHFIPGRLRGPVLIIHSVEADYKDVAVLAKQAVNENRLERWVRKCQEGLPDLFVARFQRRSKDWHIPIL